MSRHRRATEGEEVGNDSFLDVVANMVGIMIILVMVAGMRAGKAPASASAAADLTEELKQAAGLEEDVLRLAGQIEAVQRETQARHGQRAAIAYQVAAGQRLVEESRQRLDAKRRADFDLQRAAAGAAAEVARLERALANAATAKPAAVKVTSYPTPIARTVTGKELHFQLKAGRVVHVPIDEFLHKLPGEMNRQVGRLRSSDEVTDTLGPLQGFRMHYTLERAGDMVRLYQCDFIPISPSLGEPLEMAVAPDSEFHRLIASQRPQTTTVTLWTYPDSFPLYRRVKEELYQLGFVVAGRPLVEGTFIGGSPHGSKSAAQ